MNEIPSRVKVSLEKPRLEEPKINLPESQVVYRMPISEERKIDHKVVLTLPLAKTIAAEILPQNVKDASIKELSEKIAGLKEIPEQESLRDLLILHRRGKAIRTASEYKYGKINDANIGESLGKSAHVAKLIRVGMRDVSSTELAVIIKALEPTEDDTFAEKVQELTNHIEGKEDHEKILEIGPLLKDLRKSTGTIMSTFAEAAQVSPEAIRVIEKNKFRISVGKIKKIQEVVLERRKAYEEALSILRIDSEEMDERMTEGRAISTLRNEFSLAQSDLGKVIGCGQTQMSRIESGKRHIPIEKMPEVISFLSEKGALPGSLEMQFLASLHETTVPEEKREVKPKKQSKNYVSADIKKAGKIYEETIQDLQKTSGDRIVQIEAAIAATVGTTTITFQNFRLGLLPEPNLQVILKALENYLDPEDERYLAIQEIFRKRELEKKWMKTLLREDMTTKKAVKYLRLSTGLSQSEFSEKSGVPKMTITYNELGQEPFFYNLHRMIEATTIADLNTDNKPRQMLRLMTSGSNVMSQAELEQCTKGQLIRYLRKLNGVTIETLGEELGYTADTMSHIETDERPINSQALAKLINWLNLSESDEYDQALATVIKQKAQVSNETISEEIYGKAVNGKYLFAEQLEGIKPDRLSADEEDLIRGMNVKESLRVIRKNKKMSLVKLSKIVNKSDRQLHNVELGKHIPRDFIIATFMNGLGYDIHHPLTWELLNRAEAERQAA